MVVAGHTTLKVRSVGRFSSCHGGLRHGEGTETIRAALALLEQTAGNRRRCRRCSKMVVENAAKRFAA